ncbi:MAG: hypothetical protein NZ870_04390, partial [bacterium]|nr:hypothetical protein [bacterium]
MEFSELKNKIGSIDIVCILGSGLNESPNFKNLKPIETIDYSNISGLKPTTAGHKGVCQVYELYSKRVL